MQCATRRYRERIREFERPSFSCFVFHLFFSCFFFPLLGNIAPLVFFWGALGWVLKHQAHSCALTLCSVHFGAQAGIMSLLHSSCPRSRQGARCKVQGITGYLVGTVSAAAAVGKLRFTLRLVMALRCKDGSTANGDGTVKQGRFARETNSQRAISSSTNRARSNRTRTKQGR